MIARELVKKGTYTCEPCTTRLYGRQDRPGQKPFVMFILPAEPLYLAACLRYLPAGLLRYIQLPFNALLVFAASYVAQTLAGPAVAAAAGAIAALEPFVFVHGPVWDDTFTGAALDWAVFALLLASLDDAGGPRPGKRWQRVGLIALLSGCAAVTRTSSQFLLLGVGAAIVLIGSLRPIRIEALAVIAGMVLALSAWGYRNYAALGQFATGSSHDAIGFWESVYPSAREALLTQGQTEILNDERMQEDREPVTGSGMRPGIFSAGRWGTF